MKMAALLGLKPCDSRLPVLPTPHTEQEDAMLKDALALVGLWVIIAKSQQLIAKLKADGNSSRGAVS